MYKHIIRPLLFLLVPEKAHNLIFKCLDILSKIPFARPLVRLICKYENPKLEREVFGIRFPNPVGLAGGLDKNAQHYNELSDFGFGFVEVGSLTPQPQPGNPKPRLFRVPKDRAIINRMGINNDGVMEAIKHLKANKPDVIVAANIAKNTNTPDNEIAKDYDHSYSLLYDFVDMFVFNISCPNVVGLTKLQDVSYISDIMDNILDKRMGLDEYKPILLKISPDIGKEQVNDIIDYCLRSGIDGIVATNTTRSRDGLTIGQEKIDAIGNGGMSGAPLFEKSLEMVRYIHTRSQGRLPIIGVGGIMSPEQAQMMLDAGASLVEIYSGFIYEGPGLIGRILKSIVRSKDEKEQAANRKQTATEK